MEEATRTEYVPWRSVQVIERSAVRVVLRCKLRFSPFHVVTLMNGNAMGAVGV